MSSIKNIRLLLLCLSIAVSWGCSSSNQQAGFDPVAGAHVASFFSEHKAAYKSNPDSCKECHGADLKGGVVQVSCFSESRNGEKCHSGHVAGWADPNLHGTAAKAAPKDSNGFAACTFCHGANYGGDFGPTCLNTAKCHGAGINAPHAAPWITGARTHTNTDTGNASVCSLCHANGANSPIPAPSPAPPGTSPGCYNNTLCHGAMTGTCGTCHSIPPDGAVFPNIAGRHSVHTGLPHVGTDCTVCHTGAGSGTALHQNGAADVAISALYNAKSGSALFNRTAGTCSNVSCHGAKNTPVWTGGTIDVNTQCSACHVSGTSQYNSYYSGRHSKHSSYACTECHDTGKLSSVHFNDLNTPEMTQAGATIINAANYSGGTCTINCHNENHVSRSWLGN